MPGTSALDPVPEIRVDVAPGTAILSDGHSSYKDLKHFGFRHDVVPHDESVYVLGKDIHTNNIEGFWSQLRRSIDGTYHP